MRIVIVRRVPNTSFSMDVYADGLVSGLRAVRPNWEIVELCPRLRKGATNSAVHKLGKYYEQYWHYPQTIKQYSADIFHIIDHTDGHLARWLSPLPSPVIVTCHDLINFLQPENASHGAILPMFSSALWRYSVNGLRAADHIVTVSAHTAKDVSNLLDILPQRLTVVHNAVEPVFQPLQYKTIESVFEQYDIPKDRFYLLNVGSSQPRKNINMVLTALAQLVSLQDNSSAPLVHLIKAGADFTPEQKTIIDQHHLQSHVTHVKNPDKATLVKLYNLADVLLAPSLYEGFGMTILEAMACGTPVITSNVSSLPEISGDAAILIKPTDVDKIATSVRSLQTNSFLHKSFSEKGLEHVRKFTWEKSAEKVARLYETLKK